MKRSDRPRLVWHYSFFVEYRSTNRPCVPSENCAPTISNRNVDRVEDSPSICVSNPVHTSSDAVPNHDADNIDHSNGPDCNPNMSQSLFDRNANIARNERISEGVPYRSSLLTSGPSSCRFKIVNASSIVCAFSSWFNRWYCSRSRIKISLDFCSVCDTAFWRSTMDWRLISSTASSRNERRRIGERFAMRSIVDLLFVALRRCDLLF